MSRTDLDSSTLARSLRRLAGDGSIEWVMEPIQASVLLDVADALDENAKLRKQGERLFDKTLELGTDNAKLQEENERFIVKLNAEHIARQNVESDNAKLRELVKDIYVDMWALGEWLEPYEQRMRDLGIEVD